MRFRASAPPFAEAVGREKVRKNSKIEDNPPPLIVSFLVTEPGFVARAPGHSFPRVVKLKRSAVRAAKTDKRPKWTD